MTDSSALALSALALAMGGSGYKGKGWGKGKSQTPNADGQARGICFAFRDYGSCARGSSCPFVHGDGTIKKITCGTNRNKDQDTDDYSNYHIDHDDLEGSSDTSTLKITLRKQYCKALTLTREEDGKQVAVWKSCVGPAHLIPEFVELGTYVNEMAPGPDGLPLGKAKTRAMLRNLLDMWKSAGYRPYGLPTVVQSDKVSAMEDIVQRMMTGIEATNRSVASLASTMAGSGSGSGGGSGSHRPHSSSSDSSGDRPGRKKPRTPGLLFPDDMFDGDFEASDDMEADEVIDEPTVELTPEQRGWNRISTLSTAVKHHMAQFKRPSPGQLLEWPEADAFTGQCSNFRPVQEIDTTRPSEFTVEQMGHFASNFVPEDFEVADRQIVVKIIECTRLSKRQMLRISKMLEGYGVVFKGKETIPRALMGLSLEIAKDRRVSGQAFVPPV